MLKDRSADAKGVAGDHGRRFGVKVKMLYDKGLRGYAGSMTDEEAMKVAREPGVVIAPDTEVTGFEAPGSPQALAGTPDPYKLALPSGWGWASRPGRPAQPARASSTAVEKDLYHYEKTGAGVTAYVIDSGVEHPTRGVRRARHGRLRRLPGDDARGLRRGLRRPRHPRRRHPRRQNLRRGQGGEHRLRPGARLQRQRDDQQRHRRHQLW